MELTLLLLIEHESQLSEREKVFFKKGKNRTKNQEISKLEKQIESLKREQKSLEEQKQIGVFSAMEVGGKAMTTYVKKRRNLKNVAKFFSYRFNTYKVIQKNVLEPFEHRIDEFKVNQLQKVDGKAKEFDIITIEEKIQEILKKDSEKILMKA